MNGLNPSKIKKYWKPFVIYQFFSTSVLHYMWTEFAVLMCWYNLDFLTFPGQQLEVPKLKSFSEAFIASKHVLFVSILDIL